MKARFRGYCTSCATRISLGEEVDRLCGEYVHSACKKAEIAKRMLSAGEPVVLPDAGRLSESSQVTGKKSQHRKSFRRMRGGVAR